MDKSQVVAFRRWKTTAIYFSLLILSGVSGQSVTLESIPGVTSCTSGLRDGVDFYLFKGIVNATIAKYSNLVDFQIRSTSSNAFSYLCTASLVTCVTPNPQPCYCAKQTGNIYEIVANRSAVRDDNGALIRIKWDSSTGTSVFSNELPVADIYDLNAVTTIFTIDGNIPTCPTQANNGSVAMYKCQNSPKPCEVSIAVDNTVVARNDNEVMYKLTTTQASNATLKLTLGHSVCGGSVTVRTCLITIVTTPPSCPLECKAWAIALSVIYYIFIIVIIITVIFILVFVVIWKKKTVLFYMCIGFLVLAEIICIILIIVFAQAEPCTCDPGTNSTLTLWEIMLTSYCIIHVVLIIVVVVVLIWSCVCCNKSKTLSGPNRGSAEITSSTTVNASNPRKQKDNKVDDSPK